MRGPKYGRRPLIAGIYKDRRACGLLLEGRKRKLMQIFEEMDADEAGFMDLAKCTKLNRFVGISMRMWPGGTRWSSWKKLAFARRAGSMLKSGFLHLGNL